MKLRALLTWMIFCIALPVCADPIYRAGQTSSSWTSLLHGEVSVDYTFSSLKLEDYLEEYSSDRLHGFGGRALWTPLPWLGAGIEGTLFGKTDLQEAMVNSYKASRVGAVVKLTLTPDTNPRFYLLVGLGRTTHELNFRRWIGNSWPTVKKSIPYWALGLGVETTIWKNFFMGVEGNILWNQSTQLWRYHKIADHSEISLRIRGGVRF
ncbi:MAG: hypothetical protein J6Y25_04385 [Elusimicrobiaceae bacterium]|nr:hypothetical protein [Elusimicrobiaceae bacterium]